MKIAVVGGGVMGSATARALARRDHDVLLYEQFEPGHERGSSHGRTRIYRYSYPDARYVEMMQAALPLWRALEAECGEELLRVTGGIDTGKNMDAHIASFEERGVRYEVLSGSEVHERWPLIRLPEDKCLYQADGGVVYADRAWRALFDGAARAGARLLIGRRVVSIAEGRVNTDSRTEDVDMIVVTAGGWAPKLLERAGIELHVKPTRETVAFFHMEGTAPTYVDWGDPSVYALADPGHGVKVGEHIAGPRTDPDEDGRPDLESIERLSAWVSERFPAADPEPWHAETCIYTNTPDEHFVLQRHDGIVVGSACSGHGFKFAPLIGERLADLVDA